MNSDMILKADNLHFSYDDDNSHSLNGLSLKSEGDRKWPLWEPMAAESLRFSSAARESINPSRENCILTEKK